MTTASAAAPAPPKVLAEQAAARIWRRAGLAMLLLAALAVPFMVSGYHIFQLTIVLVYAIALLGLNMLTGYNGQISLGHGAFYAIGAYTTAILTSQLDVPYWATVPVAGLICLAVGFLDDIEAAGEAHLAVDARLPLRAEPHGGDEAQRVGEAVVHAAEV